MIRRASGFLMLALLGSSVPGTAQTPTEVRLDITSGGQRIRIHCQALRPGGDRTAAATAIQSDEVLAADLTHSGVFLVSRSWVPGEAAFDVQATIGGTWEVRGSQVRLTGEVRDVPAGRPILVRDYRGPMTDWRSLVHRFADDVVQQFTGESGVASTRIAFVVQEGREKELWVMDADGARAQPLTADRSIALSPNWSPEGSLLLFTSYRGGSPQIWVTPAKGGRVYLVSGRPGLNTSASYSPDGRDVVCTLSQDGNSEIYLLDARGGSPRRLTNHRGIDTSPCWSPTGREIAFTSDRGGSPQVYVMDREGGTVRRLTYDVDYTDSPAWSPRGDRIAFVARTAAGFDVYVVRPDGSGARLVVSGGSNENPRWSPDGRHLVFASNRGGSYGLWVTDLDGRPARRLDTGGRIALSPAWSPRPQGAGTATNVDPGRTSLP
jgi:TolB protein